MHTNTVYAHMHDFCVITLTPRPPCCPPASARTVYHPSAQSAASPAADSAAPPAAPSTGVSASCSRARDSPATLATRALKSFKTKKNNPMCSRSLLNARSN